MEKHKLLILATTIVIAASLLPSCSRSRNLIIIEDFIVGTEYEILLVDGKEPNRIKHGVFVTYVPFVYVNAGEHALTLQLRDKSDSHGITNDPIELKHDFKKGLRYRIVDSNSTPNIVETD